MWRHHAKKIALAFVITVFLASWIQPLWPKEQMLQSTLTLIGLVWLVWHNKKFSMRNFDFFAICFFIAIHCVAARWLYSYVPYDAFFKSTLNWSPQNAFGFERNHFDRMIHFFYGLCFIPAIVSYLQQKNGIAIKTAFGIGVMLIMCSSLVYEWFEWAIALTLSPEQAEAYNGQQGDIWDAHMDMLLATAGAVLMFPLLKFTHADAPAK
jgi:putative membrane protein